MVQQGDLWAHLKRSASPFGEGGIEELMSEAEGGMDENYMQEMSGGMPSNPKRRSSTKRNTQMMMYGGSGEGEN